MSIDPWGCPAADLPVLGRPLGQWRAEALRPPGLSGHLSAADDLWVTPALAGAFARAAARGGAPASLALRAGLQTDFAGALQELRRDGDLWIYPLSWHPSPVDEAPGSAPPLVVDDAAKPLEIPLHPGLSPDGGLTLPLTARSAVRVSHWMHLLRANQLALLAHGHDLLHTRPLRLLGAVLRARSVNKHRVMAALSRRGPGCDVHPTAVVEASVLGARVRVGAHAVVRHSHLGDGAVVGDQAHIVSSVLGAEASVGRMGMLQSCVLMRGANTGHFGHQLCVVGEDAFVGGEVVLADYTPAQSAQVRTADGTLAAAQTALLGCAVGHRTRLMAGLYVAPGRAVPSDLTVIGAQGHVLRRLPGPDALATAGAHAVWSPDGDGGLSVL